jgi:hypothetical protein
VQPVQTQKTDENELFFYAVNFNKEVIALVESALSDDEKIALEQKLAEKIYARFPRITAKALKHRLEAEKTDFFRKQKGIPFVSLTELSR